MGRTILDSFVEGILSPWIEFVFSLYISSISLAIKVIEHVKDAMMKSLSGQPIPTLNIPDLSQYFSLVLTLTSIIDLIRNLTVGYFFPSNIIAHIVGEVATIILFGSLIQKIMPSVIFSLIPSITMMIMGIILRAYVEGKVKIHIYLYY